MRAHRRSPGALDYVPSSILLRLQALVLLGVLNVGIALVVSAERPTASPQLAASVATASGARGVPPRAAGVPTTAPAPALTPAAPRPAPVPVPVPATRRAKYIPSGTGMWTYQWQATMGGNTTRVVTHAKKMGLSHIYVRTGTRKGGFDGAPLLSRLLPIAAQHDLKVIAWDFPMLENPVAEARRLAAAARYTAAGGTRVAAVAPDIETGAEGTVLTAGRVDQYYRALRSMLPADIAILATVPWPSENRVGRYPYAVTARYADAFIPMAYWINRDPIKVAATSMRYLKQFGKPVMPVGQAYDPRIDVPTLRWRAPSYGQVAGFIHTARAHGAQSVSLWVWQFANNDHWRALSNARKYWMPRPKAKPPAPPKKASPKPPAPAAATTEPRFRRGAGTRDADAPR